METLSLEEKLNYKFRDTSLLKTTLTHSSKVNEDKSLTSNERLEFLGDAVLSLTVGDYLYENIKDKDEGVLTKLRALIVCADSLYEASKKLSLGEYMLLGKGELVTGGRSKKNIAADAFEALMGAIYLDGGYEKVKQISLRLLEEIINKAIKGELIYDYKTTLQEAAFTYSLGEAEYTLLKVEGPEHCQSFTSTVTVGGHSSVGNGLSKKESEQNAARGMLEKLKLM